MFLLRLNIMNIFEKIKKIEALIERAGSDGERQSAILAKERLEKFTEQEEVEYSIHTQDMWHKKLFLAICHKHNLKPYRQYKQKYTTTMLRISKLFINEVIWPEYLKYAKILEELVDEVTAEIISKIHKDEEEIVISGEIENKEVHQI